MSGGKGGGRSARGNFDLFYPNIYYPSVEPSAHYSHERFSVRVCTALSFVFFPRHVGF